MLKHKIMCLLSVIALTPVAFGSGATSIVSGGTWGSITGAIGAQADLQSALSAKIGGSGTTNRLAYFNGSTSIASGILGIDSDYLYIYNSSDSSKYATISRSSGANISIQGFGTSITDLEFRASSDALYSQIYAGSSTGVPLISMLSYVTTHSSMPGLAILGNSQDFFFVAARRGRGVGNVTSKLNALTVSADANTSIAGTTNVNASTTVTGTSTSFLNDLGIGDDISVNGGTTWARVTAIASNTSLTVDTAIGSGGSQTITKRQAGLRLQQNDGTFLAEFDNGGKQGCRSGVTCGTATCNGASEVTVTTAAVKTNTIVLLTQQSPGGTPSGMVRVSSRSSGTSFGFICATLDTSTVGWYLIEPR